MTQIKTKIIETPKARVLVVGGLPEDAIAIFRERLPRGNWQLLGKLESITEEQWKGIVEDVEPASLGLFPDYNFKPNRLKAVSWCSSATESGLSLIESEVWLKNPHGEKPKRYVPFMGAGHYTQNQLDEIADYENELSNWDQAEEQVFHNPILFVEFKK